MKKLLLILLFPGMASAVCPMDTTGTKPTDRWDIYELPQQAYCRACREINKFPGDVQNAAWNYVMVGLGSAAYDRHYGPGSYDRYYGDESRWTVRVRNSLGQTENVTIVTKFKTVGTKRVGIIGWRIFSVDAFGKATSVTYDFQSALLNSTFKIPSSPGDDGYEAGEDCLENDGDPAAGSGGGSTLPGNGGEPGTGPGDGGVVQCPTCDK